MYVFSYVYLICFALFFIQDISDIIKNFELCEVKCNGKSCECCQKLTEPFNVEGKTTL